MLRTCVLFLSLFIVMILNHQALSADKKNSRDNSLDHYKTAKNAYLDLSKWDFNKKKILEIRGDFEFYWKKLLSPKELNSRRKPSPTGLFPYPSIWNGKKVGDQKLSHLGYATYRFKIKLPKGFRENLLLKTHESPSSIKIFVDGKPAYELGKVATTKEEYEGGGGNIFFPFTPKKELVEIVIQIANFNHREGGSWHPIFLSKFDTIFSDQTIRTGIDAFLLGSIFIMTLYHFGLYLFRRKNISTLYFGLFCLVLGLRATASGDGRFLLFLVPGISYGWYKAVEYVTFYMSVPLACLLLRSLYQEEVSKWLERITLAVGGGLSLIVILTPTEFFTDTVEIFQLFTLTVIITVLFQLRKSVKNKREGIIIFLTGFVVFVSTAITDIISRATHIFEAETTHYGVFLFVFAQSILLAKRFSKAFNQVEIDELKIRQMNLELIEKEKARTLFFHNTSHELRTPLNGIIGFVDLIIGGRYGDLTPKARKQLKKVANLAHSLKNQVNTILDLAKSKKGDLTLNNSLILLNELIEEIHVLAEGLVLQGENLKFTSGKSWEDGMCPEHINDKNKIITILRNILGNAFKFKDPDRENSVMLFLDHSPERLVIRVTDTGIGIPKEYHSKIFEEFEQVNKEAGRSYEGTGLGLAMVRNIVELMGGEIEVESQEHVGTTFTITLPQQKDVDAAVKSDVPEFEEDEESSDEVTTHDDEEGVESPEKITLKALKPYNILIVDDNEINLEVIGEVLKGNGYPVETANGGRLALEKIRENKPDLVLLDLMMPEVSGEDVLKTIRTDDNLKNIPVILLTARASQDDKIVGLNMGADDYLAKPIVTDEILLRVRNTLSRIDLVREKSQKETMERQNEIVHSLLALSGKMQKIDEVQVFLDGVLNKLNELFDNRSFGLIIEGPQPKNISHMAFKGINDEDRAALLDVQHKIVSPEANEESILAQFDEVDKILGDDVDGMKQILRCDPTEKGEWIMLGGDIQGEKSGDKPTHRLKLFMKGEALDSASLNIIKVFLDQVIGATRNKLLTNKLDKLAHSDALTGAYNRAFFEPAITAEIKHNKSDPNNNFTVLMCDVNGLKEVNDNFGHEGGDALIIRCFEVLRSSCRSRDIIARLGGDEFVVLCPSTTEEDAKEIIEKIRTEETREKVEFVNENSGELIEVNVHMSIGVASSVEYPADDVFKEADKRMYEDKEEFYKTHDRYR